MDKKTTNLITRRQAIISLATITAGAMARPRSIFAVEPVKKKLRFAALGDWGDGSRDETSLAARMVSEHRQSAFDFVLAVGDNIYPNGSGRYFGQKFESPFADLLKDRVNFFAVLGNHDVQSGRQDQTQYPLFNMGGRNYYTVSKGDGLADFFMLDSTDCDNSQMDWLENALRGSRAKWKIAVFHHPIYSSGKKHGSNLSLRKRLEPMLTSYGVKAVFSGHDHIYERTKPQQGIQYFVTGAGGKTRRGDVDLGSEIRAKSFDQDNHFMLIELDDNTMSFKAICETGETIDSGTIS